MDRVIDAITFFQYHIEQINVELGGVLREEYRKYLERKLQYFTLAIESIRKCGSENGD